MLILQYTWNVANNTGNLTVVLVYEYIYLEVYFSRDACACIDLIKQLVSLLNSL